MTMSSSRLIASALCALVVLALGFLLVNATRLNRQMPVRSPTMVAAMPPSLPAYDLVEPPPVIAPADPPSGRAAATRAAAGPEVGPTAAPGVAFDYRYAFRLAAPRIAELQERHAQMCERLTRARCRITGMLYRVVDDRDIEAMLALKVEPSIARLFGRQGVEAMVRAGGMLTESEISGADAGTSILAAGRGLAELEAALARAEARLRQRGLAYEERIRLDDEAQQLRAQIRAFRDSRETQLGSLTMTPMLFRYGSGGLVPGFAQRPTIRQAMQRAGDNFLDGATMVLIVLVTALPWALALALTGLAFRAAWRRWQPPAVAADSA